MNIDGVEVKVEQLPDLTDAEIKEYISYARGKIKVEGRLSNLTISPGKYPEDVILTWTVRKEKFERIRRITGYLVGTIDRWNNAKRAEEKDRVKHIGGAMRRDTQ